MYSLLQVRFELTVPLFEEGNTIRASDRVTTVASFHRQNSKVIPVTNSGGPWEYPVRYEYHVRITSKLTS
jgi:hypothetical protein